MCALKMERNTHVLSSIIHNSQEEEATQVSISNCCFLTCIQISQEAGKVVWYSHLLKNFLQFVVTYTVEGFGIIMFILCSVSSQFNMSTMRIGTLPVLFVAEFPQSLSLGLHSCLLCVSTL